MGEDELLTLSKVAEETGFTPRRLRQLAEKKLLPAELYGRTYLVKRTDLTRFLAEHKPTTGRPRGSRNRPAPDIP
jgi:excisionase family DNA binding protein